ncbi:MAG: ketoacyl-ACP synthase III [Deltaproteobacteria bacterium]|nr:ketoacyl-ACP synthase III [Deltaproteobacteria bacterium]
MALHILGMGHAHPDTVIDNKFIEELDVGTNEAWILEKIGIVTRLSTLPLDYIKETRNQDPRAAIEVASMSPTDLGAKAGEMALKQAGVGAEQVGLVITNCCAPNQTTPSEAQRIAQRLGVRGQAYDVFSACPAFALHLNLLNSFKEEMLPDFVLCVSTATLTQHVDYNDRSDGAIWGDGAAAWVVSPRHRGKLKVLETFFAADPSRADAVVVNTYGHFKQDGRAVRDFSVRQTVRLIKALEVKHSIDWTKDLFVGHQANKTMLDQITNNREIPESNHWHNVTQIGNQAGAGAPAVISMHWNEIQPGQRLAVAVVGAGLSWGSALFEATDAQR